MSQTIIEQLNAAVAARKDSLEQLRDQIRALIEPIPVGVVLSDAAGEIGEIQKVCTGASQEASARAQKNNKQRTSAVW